MFSSVVNLFNNIALAPESRKVKKYLDEATCDSVTADLGQVLAPRLSGWRERELLQATFDKYCIEDSSQNKYWDEGSFRKHIRSGHPIAAISDDAIRLLWRSFHFYAYHPFPRRLQDAKLDFDAFRRAALLTVFQCDGLLGTRELDWFWRNDATFFRRASFARIFRSIATPQSTHLAESGEQQDDVEPLVSDASDVLVMVGPQFMHAMPSTELLDLTARRLLAGGPTVARRAVSPEEVSTLMSLLLRTKLGKNKWGSFYHHGSVAEANPADEGLIEALVDSLTQKSERAMTSEHFLEAVNLLPNLQLRYHQLWAVLFQPAGTTGEAESSRASEAALGHITGAISLFVPHVEIEDGHQSVHKHDTLATLEEVQALSGPQDMTIFRLARDLSDRHSGYVVLFTAEAVATTPKATIGAYFPGESRGTDAHILFQLQPRFRLLRWKRPNLPLSDLIRTERENIRLGELVANGHPQPSDATYWIGDSAGQGAGIRIDHERKTVTLTSGDGQCYMDGQQGVRNWDVTIQSARMDIFKVVGAVDHKA
ncbi:hypothetical protein NKR23_g8493 [Pleurostoma richardsiae]|uniref:TLDc domain-containing protein n=1 Tax=Pleurostoma richardsiae TaxID=41990 RepID=A0AA38RI45_9PEZI|nr:hypothetical protein NKR23_g8493 [Pleurostoma richardsiae]